MQKNVSPGFPAWLERVEVPKKGGVVNYPLVLEARDLLWLANQNCVTPHVWTSRVPDLMSPDICVFDLDPSEDDPEALRVATLAVRDILSELGLRSWVKTSGSKGSTSWRVWTEKPGLMRLWPSLTRWQSYWSSATRTT